MGKLKRDCIGGLARIAQFFLPSGIPGWSRAYSEPMPSKTATLKQIDQATGVSPQTVSRILAGGTKEVWPSVARRADRIRGMAKRLGYLPNIAARSMRSSRFDAVALLSMARWQLELLPKELLFGMQVACQELGLRLISDHISEFRPADLESLPSVFRERTVDGIVVNFCQDFPETALNPLSHGDIPVVWLNQSAKFNCVRPDDPQIGRLAVEHLLRCGHRRFAYVCYHQTENLHSSLLERERGYRELLEPAGYLPDIDLSGAFVAGTAVERARSFLSAHRSSAVFCYGVHEAVAYHVAAAAALGDAHPRRHPYRRHGRSRYPCHYRPAHRDNRSSLY